MNFRHGVTEAEMNEVYALLWEAPPWFLSEMWDRADPLTTAGELLRRQLYYIVWRRNRPNFLLGESHGNCCTQDGGLQHGGGDEL